MHGLSYIQKQIMIINISNDITNACPLFVGAMVTASIVNSKYNDSLWDEIHSISTRIQDQYTNDDIKHISSIAATRRVYKALGKDPSRYRPSGEALMRRIIGGKSLYQIDTLVDLINLASMAFGYSIGGFDSDKIDGDTLILGVGKKDEPYEGIGRGMLNIEGLPVYRDGKGGIGTPTSDHERTKMDLQTTHLLAIVNGYDGDKQSVKKNAEYIKLLVEKYAEGKDVNINYF